MKWPIKWIDAHCHLADPILDETRAELLKKSESLGITHWIQGGVDPDDWTRQEALKKIWGEQIITCFGLHPWWVVTHSREELEHAFAELEQRATHASILGEMGLDQSRRLPPAHASVSDGFKHQKTAFRYQLKLASQLVFADLWHIYSQLRIDKRMLTAGGRNGGGENSRDLFLVVTSQGGLGGDVDGRTVATMLKEHDAATTDIIVMGGHGAALLTQMNIAVLKSLPMPESNEGFDVSPIVTEVQRHGRAIAFFPSYVSLVVQEVFRLELISAVKALSEESGDQGEIISERDYDFEPSLLDIVDYLEAIMLEIVLGQVVLDSKLAQVASRFAAMGAAKQKAKELQAELRLAYNRAKRAISDERTREIIGVLNNQ